MGSHAHRDDLLHEEVQVAREAGLEDEDGQDGEENGLGRQVDPVGDRPAHQPTVCVNA